MKFAALRTLIIYHLSFIILILLSTFYFLSSATPIYAATQTAPAQSGTTAPPSNTNPDVPNNLHNWTQTVMIEVMSSLTCQIAGVDPINPKQSCLGADTKTGKIGFLPSPQEGGAIGFMGNMITTLYTPPLHTADYFKDLASNFGINKKAYAQTTGTGFQSLTPLIGIWSAFRNIVYLLLVIVFVVIGLAIMLRVKIDPRTVMTIQNQIPKIIVGILAVTFSFAIAGFLIDMMWVLIYLLFGIISGIDPNIAKDLNPSVLQGGDVITSVNIVFGGVSKIAQDVSGPFTSLLGNILGINQNVGNTFVPFWETISSISKNGITDIRSASNTFIDVTSSIAGIAAGANADKIPGVKGLAENVVRGTVGYAAYSATETLLRTLIPWGIAWLIIFIALLTALFRLWFSLIMAYVQILLAVVLAPFWIIGGIVPGSSISLSGWLKNIGANLLAFPTVLAMFMLARVFTDAFANKTATGQNFVPPLIGNAGDPSLIGSLISLGMILMTPNVISMLKEMLKAPKMDTGIGKSISGATGVVTGTGKSTIGAGSAYLMGDPLTGKKGAEGLRTALTRKFFG